MTRSTLKVTTRVVASYAALGFAIKALTLPLISYLPPAMAQATGLSLATVGVLFMVARLWDIVLDPIAGHVIDRFDPPLGPRKFWVLAAAPLMLLTIPPLFAPAWFGVGAGGDVAGPALLLLVFYFGWTLMSVAHAAWPGDLARGAADRTRLIAWREWAGVLGMIAIVAAPAVVEQVFKGRLADQLTVMGGFALVAIPLALAATVAWLPAGGQRRTVAADPLAAFRLVGDSSPLRWLLLADLLSGGGFAMISATAFFIIGQYLDLAGRFSTLMLVYFLGMVAGVPLFLRITLRRGPRRSFLLAMVGAAVATLCFAGVPKGAFWAAALLQLATGLFTGGYQTNLNAVMVQVADHHRRDTGRDATGAHFALLALTNKVGYALAIGVSYPLLQVLGFHPGGQPTPAAMVGLLAIGLGGAALFLVAGGLALQRLPGPVAAGTAVPATAA
ncbi:MFS transporter [Azospirillum sp. B4]|uniref:MFS transporter n=1 Tax=Azospirillum sp. B4 TaxID=95605 RepID=UPI000347ED8E|nr:MFS transporter [Azospirillum sp. B4]